MRHASALQAFVLLVGIVGLSGCGTSPMAPLATSATAIGSTDMTAERAYAIEDTVGIGPVYGQKLRAVGVTNTGKLLDGTSTRYQRQTLAAKAAIPYSLVLRWSQAVDLMRIDGIGVRQSRLLAAIGVNSVQELAQRDPNNLQDRLGVANAFGTGFVAGTPSVSTTTKWVTAAQKLAQGLDDQS